LANATVYSVDVSGASDAAGNTMTPSATTFTSEAAPSTSTVHLSTIGNTTMPGLGSPDDADIYSWDGTSCARVFDASANGLPGNADIDGLTVKGGTYYMSFNRNGGVSVPAPVGTVQDEAVVAYDTASPAWSLHFSGAGLELVDGQDVDALHVP
jgi:hypothetical protein